MDNAHLDSKLTAFRESANLYRQYENQGRVSVSLLTAFSIMVASFITNNDVIWVNILAIVFMLIVAIIVLNIQLRLNELQLLYFRNCRNIEKDLGIKVYSLWFKPSKVIIKITNTLSILIIIIGILMAWLGGLIYYIYVH